MRGGLVVVGVAGDVMLDLICHELALFTQTSLYCRVTDRTQMLYCVFICLSSFLFHQSITGSNMIFLETEFSLAFEQHISAVSQRKQNAKILRESQVTIVVVRCTFTTVDHLQLFCAGAVDYTAILMYAFYGFLITNIPVQEPMPNGS